MSQDYNAICSFLYREARLLDDRQWDEWLDLYSESVEYWMPAWDDDDRLTEDPHSQISLIYYPNRNGLEDRGDAVDVRYNFHTLSHRYKATDQFFGTMFVTLQRHGDSFRIARKKIVLKNDYIRQVIDVYHV